MGEVMKVPETTGSTIAFAIPTHAQTFKETLRWMHNTASCEGGGYHSGDKSIMDETEVPLSNTCHNFVIIQTTHYSNPESRPDHVWKITMDLSAIEPSKVQGHAVEGKPWSYVDIGTTNDEDAIHTPRSEYIRSEPLLQRYGLLSALCEGSPPCCGLVWWQGVNFLKIRTHLTHCGS